MENKNWFKELEKYFRAQKGEQDPVISEAFFPFMNFVSLPPAESFVLARISAAPRRLQGLKVLDLVQSCLSYFPKEIIHHAIDSLISNGWIYTKCASNDSTNEKVLLKSETITAFKNDSSSMLPQFNPINSENDISILALKAVSLRRNFISLSDWKNFCDDFILKNNFKDKIISLDINDEYSDAVYFLTFVFGLSIYENGSIPIDHVYNIFSKDQISRFFWANKYFSSDSPLIVNNLILIHENYGDESLSVSEDWIKLFYPEIKIKQPQRKSKLLSRLNFEKVPQVDLFYELETSEMLGNIEAITCSEKFPLFESKMAEMGLPIGLTVLISGGPGTGKTEFCKQLGRKTNRDLFIFEAANARSKWYGETERNVKQVFEEYKAVCSSKQKPILLFNEADSIFSSRGSNKTAIGQVENVIQTILLNELEVFEGILVATTNRPESFDKAFTRRFHFHLELGPPDVQTKIALLKKIFPDLDISQCNKLSLTNAFTGSDLMNIKRKLAIYELIHEIQDVFQIIEKELADIPTNKFQQLSKIGYSLLNQTP
jgi:hypothetical protein